jgi:DNA-binding transcriptional regulator YiaG
MPSTRSYKELHDRVVARPGASERLTALRDQTLAEIDLHDLRRALNVSQSELAAELGISQSAISQLERADDLRLSTLQKYLERLGAHLELVAVFDDEEGHVLPIRVGEIPTKR